MLETATAFLWDAQPLRVLLASAPHADTFGYSMPPPGLLRLGGTLRERGVEVVLEDLAYRLAAGDVPADAVAPEAAALPGATLAPAPPFSGQAASADDAARAADCLTAAVYYEARSEPVEGQRAVAQVVLNRVRDRAFPRSVCGVVYQRSSRGCQFSFVCDGSMERQREPNAWDRAAAVARGALAGLVYDPVGSATFYHTTAILPWWAPSLSRIGTVGTHIFYRWRGGMERALKEYIELQSCRAAYWSTREGEPCCCGWLDCEAHRANF